MKASLFALELIGQLTILDENIGRESKLASVELTRQKKKFKGGTNMANEYQKHLSAAQAPDFWERESQQVSWTQAPTQIVDETDPRYPNWFADGMLNTCYNCVDRHVENGRGDDIALIFESGYSSESLKLSYSELQYEVSRVAGMISALGVNKGDRVVIYMPMIHQAVLAMLACARIGAVHSVVFGGFAANELAKRIEETKPKLILSASCGIEPNRTIAYKPILDEALSLCKHKPRNCIILQRPQLMAPLNGPLDLDWAKASSAAEPVDCVSVSASDPLYILYTSGTTGTPKGVVRDNGGHATALIWSMRSVYDARPTDVFWAASDIGWVVGHSYSVYAPLLLGCTSLIYEGKPVGTPDADQFWRVIERHKVNLLFTAPTAIRAIKKEDPTAAGMKGFDLSSLRALFLAGERSDPDTIGWSERGLGVPVIDHWWQTELGWPALATCIGLGETDIRIGSAGKPVPGFHFMCLGEQHRPVEPGQTGDLVIKLPLPPGCLPTLWQKDDVFISSYLEAHPGYYLTGDAGYIDQDGYVHVMSRTDDLINVAGHRLSTGAIEQVVASHPDVAECAAFGVKDSLKGEVPLALFVLNASSQKSEEQVSKDVISLVREQIGAVASFKRALAVAQLPKTRSGKILRGLIRSIASQENYSMPATIENVDAIACVEAVFVTPTRCA